MCPGFSFLIRKKRVIQEKFCQNLVEI
uniref:Uncharacterized protein n=1 Tax=Arundo donax TaxID=35708 RepID=A0A0A9B1T9_ARUDO